MKPFIKTGTTGSISVLGWGYEVDLEPVKFEGPQASKRRCETGKRYQEQELRGNIWAEDSLSFLIYKIKLVRVLTSIEMKIK